MTDATLTTYSGEAARGGRTMRLQYHRGAIKRQLDAILGVRTRGCCSVGARLMVRANGIGWSAVASRCTPGGQAPIRDADGQAIAGVVNYTEAFFLDPTDGNVYRAAIWAGNRDAGSYVGTLTRVS
jgi:hypothetical protein